MGLLKILLIVVAAYLVFLIFTKITKWIFRIVIIALLLGMFYYGYTNIDDFFASEPAGLPVQVIEEPEIPLNLSDMNETAGLEDVQEQVSEGT